MTLGPRVTSRRSPARYKALETLLGLWQARKPGLCNSRCLSDPGCHPVGHLRGTKLWKPFWDCGRRANQGFVTPGDSRPPGRIPSVTCEVQSSGNPSGTARYKARKPRRSLAKCTVTLTTGMVTKRRWRQSSCALQFGNGHPHGPCAVFRFPLKTCARPSNGEVIPGRQGGSLSVSWPLRLAHCG